MIKCKIDVGEEENKVIKEISLDCLGNKTKRLIIRICLLLIAVIIVLQMIFDPPMNGGSIDIMAFIVIALDILLAIFARKIHELIFYIRSKKADPSENRGLENICFLKMWYSDNFTVGKRNEPMEYVLFLGQL